MKILTFLGVGNYGEVSYHWEGRRCKTKFFPEAIATWYPDAEMRVFLTPKAKAHLNWRELQERLTGKHIAFSSVDIPSGESMEELWELFERVQGCLEPGDKIIFDITHSFRSLPVLSLLITAYLRIVHTVALEKILYGAFDAKEGDDKPVFDLTPFVHLLDWITATDQFLKTGDGSTLASLLRRADSRDTSLQALAGTIKGVAQGLQLLRPISVMKQAAVLPEQLDRIEAETLSPFARPLLPLLNRVREDYGRYGLENPERTVNKKTALLCQLHMVEWYAEKGQFVHALSLAREWILSLCCVHFDLDPLVAQHREEMELLLNHNGIQKNKQGKTLWTSSYYKQWNELEQRSVLRSVWHGEIKLANLRNDVLHAGFRRNSASVCTIQSKTQIVIEKLKEIACLFGVEETPA